MKFAILCAVAALGTPMIAGAEPQGDAHRPSASVAKPHPAAAAARAGQDDSRIQQRATAIDRRIDAAVAAGRLSRTKAARLHLRVGRVQTEAGHAARTQAALTAQQARAFETTLSGIESAVPRR